MKNDKKEGNAMNECHNGQYPYPDQNIFLVTGAPYRNEKPRLSKSMTVVVIAQRSEVAQQYFVALKPDQQDWRPYSVVSLKQLIDMKERMEQAHQHPESVQDVSQTRLLDVLASKQPWLVRTQKAGQEILETIVLAKSFADLEAWSEAQSVLVITALPYDDLNTTIEVMSRNRYEDGEASYAYDIEKGEQFREMDLVISKWTPQEHQEEEELADAWLSSMSPSQKSAWGIH